jgi:hypothetical protein
MPSHIGEEGAIPRYHRSRHLQSLDEPPPLKWHFSQLSGKCEGILSVSTSCLDAPFCRARRATATDDDVCSVCYARASIVFRRGMDGRLRDNRKMLNRPYVAPDRFPMRVRGNDTVALRLLSHGDVSSVHEANNLLRLARDAPATLPIALWTKNVVAFQFATVEPPPRLQYVYSSRKLDVVEPLPGGFHRVFTVFRPTTPMPDDVYACGGRCSEIGRAHV